MNGYRIPVRLLCEQKVYVEASSKAEARALVRAGEWDEPGELHYVQPIEPRIAGAAVEVEEAT